LTTCLDTSFVFNLLAGDSAAADLLPRIEPPIVESALSYYELLAGETNRGRIERVEGFAQEFAVVPVTFEVCSLAAEIQMRLQGRGEPIPKIDALLAATSILVRAPLVTADEHFRRVPSEFGLLLREYRDRPAA